MLWLNYSNVTQKSPPPTPLHTNSQGTVRRKKGTHGKGTFSPHEESLNRRLKRNSQQFPECLITLLSLNRFATRPSLQQAILTPAGRREDSVEKRQHRSAHSRYQRACHATARHISNMSTHVRSTRPRKTHRMWPSENENRVQFNLAIRKSSCRNYTAMLFYLTTRIALYSVVLGDDKQRSVRCHSNLP